MRELNLTDAAFSQAEVSHCSCEDCGDPKLSTADDDDDRVDNPDDNNDDGDGDGDDDDDDDDDDQMIGHLEVAT